MTRLKTNRIPMKLNYTLQRNFIGSEIKILQKV